MSIHMTYIQRKIFPKSKTENFTSPVLRSETKSILWVPCGPFFMIGENKNFLRDQLRINSDIYDAKFEMCRINIK